MTPEPTFDDPTELTRAPQAAQEQVDAPEPDPDAQPERRYDSRRVLSMFGVTRISAVYLWILFTILFAIITPSTFLTSTTIRLVFSQGVVTCLLALAFLLPLAAGVYDLSIGALMSLALAISVYLQIHTGLAPGVGAILAMLACLAFGAFNGFVVIKLRVNSFIATLGTSQILLAIVLLISDNNQLTATFPNLWSEIGNNDFIGIPIVVWILLVVALILWYVLEFTRIGRYLLATGGNPDAARLSGVKTNRMIWGAFIASAAICGLAGIIYSMQSGLFSSDTGPGYLFPAVTAVFLGASQLSHRPNVWGTLIAYFALAFGVQGLVLAASSASAWSQPLFQGVALIIAVAFASRPALRRLREQRRDDTGAG
jgi:ribose transport system permease protein